MKSHKRLWIFLASLVTGCVMRLVITAVMQHMLTLDVEQMTSGLLLEQAYRIINPIALVLLVLTALLCRRMTRKEVGWSLMLFTAFQLAILIGEILWTTNVNVSMTLYYLSAPLEVYRLLAGWMVGLTPEHLMQYRLLALLIPWVLMLFGKASPRSAKPEE